MRAQRGMSLMTSWKAFAEGAVAAIGAAAAASDTLHSGAQRGPNAAEALLASFAGMNASDSAPMRIALPPKTPFVTGSSEVLLCTYAAAGAAKGGA